jgi:excinuclease UvrABC ATPase subunit
MASHSRALTPLVGGIDRSDATRVPLAEPVNRAVLLWQRSHSGAEGPTRDQLYEEAKKRNIQSRSSMTKQQLENALGR